MREILATEMLEALGVYTSKTFSLVETGEALDPRRRALADALVGARAPLAQPHPHRHASSASPRSARPTALRRLVDHSIAHYWPDAAADARPGRRPSTTAWSARSPTLGAEWFAAGFVHGVLNTDNINITGESFDYGPWRFLDRFDPGFTAAYFDQTGLYAFARQPEALNWNLARLGECLIPLSSRAAIEPVFDSFADRFQTALARQTFARLGLLPGDDPAAARALMHRFWGAMQETAPPFQQVFHDLLGGGLPERLRASPLRPLFETAAWAEVIDGPARPRPRPGLAAAARPTRRRRAARRPWSSPRSRRSGRRSTATTTGRPSPPRSRPSGRRAPSTAPSASCPARTPGPAMSRSTADERMAPAASSLSGIATPA